MTVLVIRNSADTARFDPATETWTVTTANGRCETAPVVIDTRPGRDDTIAVHGLPNYFRIPGPDVERQTRLVQRCLDLFARSGATRIEARSRIRVRRGLRRSRPLARQFYLSDTAPVDDDGYDGPASVTLADGAVEVHARLCGHLDPIDGHYHWRGTVVGDLPADMLRGARTITMATPGHQAQARISEPTPWGGFTVTGVGDPPYPLH
ncbi:DUF4873 domain-containing protein [Mycolicibacterium mengxianglii]|uniref:DUF4873 domain-containing protein n=1 Tax=Mycolicibacterium mengxianglii TaxID=2736649 RepID=UPI0018EF0049|nr:DUF4873 domain-containing protein [Mycolicibacterium mengxianglii]